MAQKGLVNKLLFWKRGGDKGACQAEAVEKLRNLQEMMEKKSAWLEAKIESETKTAIENRTKNKRGALMALRRRQRLQKQLTNLDNTMTMVEVQLESLTEAQVNVEIVRSLQQGSAALRQAQSGISVDKVQDLRDEIEDLMEDSNQIQDILGQPLGGDTVDEDELLAELEELEQEDTTKTLTSVHLDLPPVPVHNTEEKPKIKPRKSKEAIEEEEELRKLAEWM